jgi:hypothetical protein
LLKNLQEEGNKKQTPNYPTSAARGLLRNNRQAVEIGAFQSLRLHNTKKGLAKIAENCGR